MNSTNANLPVQILIVDDHPNTANMLARAIAQLGTRVHASAATSGNEALELIRASSVDILITDMVMPEMNGLELLEKLQNHPGGRPSHTILITAYDVPGLKETARRLKVDEIIAKPVRPERICQSVEKFLASWSPIDPPTSPAAAKKPFRILIADDHPDNVTLLARYIGNEGYDYISAADGEETVQKTKSELPDLVLLDINMPKKDGFIALKEIRADPLTQNIPVIILTAARLEPSEVQSGLNLGADDYVTKPFDRRELMARIRTKLRVKEAEDHLVRQNRELSMLLEVTGMLSAREKLDTILGDVLELIVKRLGADAGYLFDFGTPSTRLFPKSATAVDARQFRELLHSSARANGICMDKTDEDASWGGLLGSTVHSAIVVPTYDRLGVARGAILLTHSAYANFKQEHVPILQAIANQILVTIENAAWYESLHGSPK